MLDILIHIKTYIKNQKWVLVTIPLVSILFFFVTQPHPHKGKINHEQFTYLGMIRNGAHDGSGTMTFTNGDTYNGNFKSGKFDAKGTFISKSDHWSYTGNFKAGTPNGDGIMKIGDKETKVKMRNGMILK